MDLSKVLTQLREELAKLDAAIQSLERLRPDAPRRGRPPKNRLQVEESTVEEPRADQG